MSEYWLTLAQYSMVAAMLLLGAIGFGFAAAMPGMDRWSRRFFMCFFAVLVLLTGVCCADDITTRGGPTTGLVIQAVGFLDSLLISVLVFMPTVYLLHCCNEPYRKGVLFRITFAIWVTYVALLVIAQFSRAFYYYTPDGQIVYGPWYPLTVLTLAAIAILSLVGTIRRRNKLSKRLLYAFLAFYAPLSVAALIHMVTPSFLLVDVAVTIAALSMFVIVVFEQIERYLRLQQETARQRAKIAVLQMRPHFIHNTMTSIYHLCEQDPMLAKQVTLDFNTYLRKNLAAIAKDEPIPFEEELEHARAYLAVEQAQFASKLVIGFDTPHTRFKVPPLTLQPLVENAVKHGMTPKTTPLHVSIRTRKTEAGSEVVVEDDGPGFDAAVADDPHTTLANIRQRLEMMCGGALEITPREGGGTEVKVTIPR